MRFKFLLRAPLENIIKRNLSVYRALQCSEDPLRFQGIRIALVLHFLAF
jgi:hypothetical protein